MKRAALGVVFALCLSACSKNLCDRSEAFDLGSKAGTCGSLANTKVLGGAASCTANLASCTSDDQRTLESILGCHERLPVCASDEIATWTVQQLACLNQVKELTPPCQQAFFPEIATPMTDGGVDGGVDAGRQPDTDGGGAVTLIAVADESAFALAWSASQPTRGSGSPFRWELNSWSDAGTSFEYLTPANLRSYTLRDAGTGETRSFFMVALEEDGRVTQGVVLTPVVDAGTPDAGGCMEPTDCAKDRVCSVGVCKTVACSGVGTCPAGYDCLGMPAVCTRNFEKDAGVQVGPQDAGEAERPLPFLSPLVTATTGPTKFRDDALVVSPFSGKDPDIAAIDSARQVVAVEQDNQLFAYVTDARGARFTVSRIDTVGSKVKLAYQPSNDTLYACYETVTDLGPGVRVRRSRDHGKTWGAPTEIADIVAGRLEDGGVSDVRVRDCDIAPWRNDQVLVATVEGDDIKVRTVTDNLILGAPDVALQGKKVEVGPGGNLPPGGETAVWEPRHLSLATLPSDFQVHVAFAASRMYRVATDAPWTPDTDVFAVFRDASSGGIFSQAAILSVTYPPRSGGLEQDWPTVLVDPRTRRAVAAFTATETSTQSGSPVGTLIETVYVALFDPTSRTWGTGGDLNVFCQSEIGGKNLLFPERDISPDTRKQTWDAFAPSLAVTEAGRIYLTFVAGRRVAGQINESRPYTVEFSFETVSPLSTTGAKGWFVAPANRLAANRPQSMKTLGTGRRQGNLSTTADRQLSVYSVFVEGVGPSFDEPGRPLVQAVP